MRSRDFLVLILALMYTATLVACKSSKSLSQNCPQAQSSKTEICAVSPTVWFFSETHSEFLTDFFRGLFDGRSSNIITLPSHLALRARTQTLS